MLLQKNNGDIRSTLNDLQVLTKKGGRLSVNEVNWLAWRDRTESIFEVLKIVFNSPTVAAARRATNVSDVDHEMLFQWILENAPSQITEPHELSEAMNALAEADMFYARIRKTQQWHLLSYALDLMTAGVAIAKRTRSMGWVPMKFPQRIATMSRTRMMREQRKALGAAIGAKSHVSARRALQLYMPLIQFVLEHDSSSFERIGDWLEIRDELGAFLKGRESAPASDS